MRHLPNTALAIGSFYINPTKTNTTAIANIIKAALGLLSDNKDQLHPDLRDTIFMNQNFISELDNLGGGFAVAIQQNFIDYGLDGISAAGASLLTMIGIYVHEKRSLNDCLCLIDKFFPCLDGESKLELFGIIRDSLVTCLVSGIYNKSFEQGFMDGAGMAIASCTGSVPVLISKCVKLAAKAACGAPADGDGASSSGAPSDGAEDFYTFPADTSSLTGGAADGGAKLGESRPPTTTQDPDAAGSPAPEGQTVNPLFPEQQEDTYSNNSQLNELIESLNEIFSRTDNDEITKTLTAFSSLDKTDLTKAIKVIRYHVVTNKNQIEIEDNNAYSVDGKGNKINLHNTAAELRVAGFALQLNGKVDVILNNRNTKCTTLQSAIGQAITIKYESKDVKYESKDGCVVH